MKYKVGDKVRIKSHGWYDANKNKEGAVSKNESIYSFVKPMSKYLGMEATITELKGLAYSIDLDRNCHYWYDWMFEDEPIKENIITKLTSAIIEASKNQPIMVEPLENGGFKVTPIEEEKEENQSGIYLDEDEIGVKNVYVVFGGGILVANGECHGKGNYCIGFQELDEVKECGTEHNENWKKNKPAVHLIINNKKTIEILRDALNKVEEQLNKED